MAMDLFLSLTQDAKVEHIKGFGSGISTHYDDDALALMRGFDILVWDGDPPNEGGFTRLVPSFLHANPVGTVIAFKYSNHVAMFWKHWSSIAAQFPDRIFVVPVDSEGDAKRFGVYADSQLVNSLPGGKHHFFILGRIGLKASRCRRVISLGGGSVSRAEASVSMAEGVHWTVFALGRGNKEEHPSLLDYALEAAGPYMDLVRGRDPSERNGFASL